MTDIRRLLARIDKRRPEECWPWTGALNHSGYGQFWLNGMHWNASRAAYFLLVGEIPDSKVVCHSCDNPKCCNPAHLWLGSQADNVRDCSKKGRARGQFHRQSAHPRHTAKLTSEQVIDARRRYADGVSQSQIARELGVNSSTISRAVRGEKWSHLK